MKKLITVTLLTVGLVGCGPTFDPTTCRTARDMAQSAYTAAENGVDRKEAVKVAVNAVANQSYEKQDLVEIVTNLGFDTFESGENIGRAAEAAYRQCMDY